MCLIAFHWQPGTHWRLRLAANRDEFYARAAQSLHWQGAILAGRDEQSGGTWLGATANGRFAALTNFRDPSRVKPGRESRGTLPLRFLQGNESAAAFIAAVRAEVAQGRYNDFNLLVMADGALHWFNSRYEQTGAVSAGAHALSNALLDTPWPKAQALRAAFAAQEPQTTILQRLADRRTAPDAQLPQTGIGLELERALSAAFIALPDYGTRCTTWLELDSEAGRMSEWTWPSGEQRDFAWPLRHRSP